MWHRLISNCRTVVRNTSASSRHMGGEFLLNRSRRTQSSTRNIITSDNYNIMSNSISRALCTDIKTNKLPTLNEIQSYNTDQLCQWLARYSEETNSDTNSAANTSHTRIFNDQTITALRGQLIDGPSLFNYPSARSIQCSGVQHKQAQRLFELIQLIKRGN